MKVITSIKEMQEYVNRVKGLRGFIPTMGFLHDGHISLIKKARNQCDIVIASIFVNPAQFGPNEDFEKYPRDFESDKILCEQVGVDVLFHPPVKDIYPKNYHTYLFGREISIILKQLPIQRSAPRIIGDLTIEISSENTEKVEFYIDNILQGTDDSEPFTHNLETTQGLHTLEIRAYKDDKISLDIVDFYKII